MAAASTGGLRGYDSYPVSLGDEMRGERACLGKSLLDVQRDLRIKAAYIDAIENSDPARIPYRGFVTGYVRAYARYLGMDEDTVMRRFCAESGFAPATAEIAPRPSAGAGAKARLKRDDLDAAIAGSRLAAVSRAEAYSADLGATVRAAASLAVLVALVGGLGYGGWAVLRDIQRVEFAPAPQAPEALAEAPALSPVTRIVQAGLAPAAPAIDERALAAVYAAQEAPPPVALRDGPIAALDPAAAGVFADERAEELAAELASAAAAPAGLGGAGLGGAGLGGAGLAGVAPGPAPAAPAGLANQAHDAPLEAALAAAEAQAGSAAPVADGPGGVALVAEGEAWVRVRDGGGATLHERLMRPGEVWRAPPGAQGLTLRAGNAGGVFVEVDGARFGPLGRPGAVVSNISLDPAAVRERFPAATAMTAPVRSAALP